MLAWKHYHDGSRHALQMDGENEHIGVYAKERFAVREKTHDTLK